MPTMTTMTTTRKLLTALWFALALATAAPAQFGVGIRDDTPASGTPNAHAASHELGGSDEIDVTGLSGTGGGAVAWLTPTFGGDGSDGAYAPAGSDSLDTGSLKQYTSVTIADSATITCAEANGICRVAVSGNLTLGAGAILDADGLGGAGGAGSSTSGGADPALVVVAATASRGTSFIRGGNGAGGGGGARAVAGTALSGGDLLAVSTFLLWGHQLNSANISGGANLASDANGNPGDDGSVGTPSLGAYSTAAGNVHPLVFIPGAGGGGGGVGKNNSANDGTGGNGGDGGGIQVWEVAGTCTFGAGSVIRSRGLDGGNGTGTVATAGSGGGGGGGIAVIRCGTIVDNGLTITAAGGSGGTSAAGSSFTGGAGGDGVAGYTLSEEVN